MRVLHVITSLYTGGAEIMLLRLLSASSPEIEHAVISLQDQGTIGPRIRELGIPVYSLGLRPLMPNPLRALSIRRLTRQLQPDLIQGWMNHGNFMAIIAAGALRRPVPVIWGVHQSLLGFVSKWPTAVLIRINAHLSRRPAAIVYVSRAGRQQHEAIGYHADKAVVIPNGIDCQAFAPDEISRRDFRQELGLAPGSILVGLVARYDPIKDHRGFLQAAALLAARHADVFFVLAGKNVTMNQPTLRQDILERGLQSRVFLLGERSDTARLMAALDIACSASSGFEAFSLAISEAMACGTPCVVTNAGDNPYIVGNTGLSVPPRQPQAMADAIGQLIDGGPELRQRLGSAARRRIESEFSLSEIARRYEELYAKVLALPSPAALTK